MKPRVATLALVLAVVAVPSAIAAGSAKPKVASLQITAVGRLPFPERGYVIDLPQGAAISANRVHISENGIEVGRGEFTFAALSASNVSSATILAIDASDSMAGKPEVGAIAAAKTFVAQRRGNQEVGLIAFNGNVNVLRAPTIDPGQLQSALANAPQLGYGTHLFDAVRRSLRTLAAAKISAGSIVLLSDGADLGSTYTLQQVVTAAKAQHVRVFTVGLRSGAFDGSTLKALAAQTPAQDNDDREHDVVLFFDAEAPGVEKRPLGGERIEVPAGIPEINVGDERRNCDQALREGLHLVRQHPEPRRYQTCHHHEEQRREYAARTSFVESGDGEPSRLPVVENLRRDEVAADYEEHVDADETAAEPIESRVKQDDGDDRQRSQSIDLGPVIRCTVLHDCH